MPASQPIKSMHTALKIHVATPIHLPYVPLSTLHPPYPHPHSPQLTLFTPTLYPRLDNASRKNHAILSHPIHSLAPRKHKRQIRIPGNFERKNNDVDAMLKQR